MLVDYPKSIPVKTVEVLAVLNRSMKWTYNPGQSFQIVEELSS
jgi:hypothetical protein